MTNMMPDMLVPDLHQFTCMAEEATRLKIITNYQLINFLQSFFILFGDFATHHFSCLNLCNLNPKQIGYSLQIKSIEVLPNL